MRSPPLDVSSQLTAWALAQEAAGAPADEAEAGAEAKPAEAPKVAPGDRDELWADLWAHGPLETIDAGQFYRVIGRTGINYGPTFRMVKRMATNDKEGMLRCARARPARHLLLNGLVKASHRATRLTKALSRAVYYFEGPKSVVPGSSRPGAEPCARRRRWDECWIRLLDGMLQLSFSDSNDYQLRIPVRVRNIAIRQPAGRPGCQLLVRMDRYLGTVENELASITGMELMAAPRRAGGNAYTCAARCLHGRLLCCPR